MSEEIKYESLNLQIPELIKKYPLEKQREIFDYLNTIDDHQRKAYTIAFNHLGSSFSIYNSNGFKEWQQQKKTD
jgi:hypothetical protein